MSIFDVRYDRDMTELVDLLTDEEYLVIDPVKPAEELHRVLVMHEGIGNNYPMAWGIGASEFDAGMRAVLALNPDHIIDYPEYERDYEDEENF